MLTMFDQNTNLNPQQGGPARSEKSKKPITKFTDINIDCQEHIFKYLGMDDLLNIADSSKQFKTAANLIFAKKYANEQVDVELLLPYRTQNKTTEEEIGHIKFAKTCLQLIRNFGHSITVLKLEPINVLHYTLQVKSFITAFKCAINYINEYCAESLTELGIRQCPKGFLKFLKPLPNVKTVEIDSFGFVGLSKDSLNTLFPKMHRLSYIDFDQSLGIIENHFPHLEHLGICRGVTNDPWDNISPDVLKLNPQLRSLDGFYIGSDVNILRCIENLKQLEELELWCDMKYNVFNDFDGETFHFSTVKTFDISFIDYENKYRAVPLIPFTFDQLENCSIYSNLMFVDDHFFDRIPTIMKLKLNFVDIYVRLQIIAEALPLLVEFEVSSYKRYSNEDIIEFINQLPSLQKACVCSYNEYEFEELTELLGNRWHASIDGDPVIKSVTLERLVQNN